MGGSVLQDKKTGHWYIQVRWQNNTEKFFTFENNGLWFPFESERHAHKILSVMQDEIDRKAFTPSAYRKNSPLFIAQYAKIWIEAAGVCKNAKKGYRSHIKHAVKYFGENFDIRDFTQAHSKLILFKNQLHSLKTGEPLSNDAVYNVMGALKTMLNFYRCDNPYFVLPVFPKMSKTAREDTKYLSFEDQQIILEAIPARHRPIFQFAMEFGIRPQEATALKWDCVTDTDVTFRRSHSEYELRETTKTGAKGVRTEALTTRALEALRNSKNWPSFKGWVFCHNERGSHYDNKILNKIWKSACAQTGFIMPLYEAIRHSWGCQLMEMGLSIEDVRDAFRHTSTKTTRRYAHRKRSMIADALENRGNVVQFKKSENQ